MTMKAAVWYGGKDIRIEDMPKPKIRNNEVLVKVQAVGICGSELHAYEGVSKEGRRRLSWATNSQVKWQKSGKT